MPIMRNENEAQLQTIAEEAFGERPSESLRKKGVQVKRSVRRSFF